MTNTDFVGLTADFKISQWLTADGLWTRVEEASQSSASKTVSLAMGAVKTAVVAAALAFTANTAVITQISPSLFDTGRSEQSSQMGGVNKVAAVEIAELKKHINSLHERLKTNVRSDWHLKTLTLAKEVAKALDKRGEALSSNDWAEKLIKSQHVEA